MEVELGDAVEYEIGDDVLIIGWVTSRHTDDHEETVHIYEAHAFHRLWGGSNAERGKELVAPAHKVKPVRSAYRHIVQQVKDKHDAQS